MVTVLPHRRKNFRNQGNRDPYWSNVVLLLHCDGTNGSTAFIDSSSSAKTVTANGNAQITTTDPKFGTGAYLGDGNADFLTLADSDDWHFGSGDWTVECFLRIASTAGTNRQVMGQRSTSIFCPFVIEINFGVLRVFISYNNSSWTGGGTPAITGSLLSINTWYHIALCREGENLRLFIDGVQSGSTFNIGSNSFTNSNQLFNVGGFSTTCTNGRIDEVRITKGVARYTADFTPPTQAFPDS